ncbi:MAG: DUF2339 domain-containing protein, partial [Proteobacteria bacterium]|nr:DUF2339 domain-containing protein [Pseudomonadota bacterium]
MSVSDNLRVIADRQKCLLEELERETATLARTDMTREIESLSKKAEKLREALVHAKVELKRELARNTELTNALHEQIYSEKLELVRMAQKKNNAYFQAKQQGELDRLTQLDESLRRRIRELTDHLKRNHVDTSNALYAELEALSARIAVEVARTREVIEKEAAAYRARSSEDFDALAGEPVSRETVEAIRKKNNIEAFIGGNLINKGAILLFILGLIGLSRLAIPMLTDAAKGCIMFAVAGLLLAGGEWMNRKKPSIFSLGLTGGGIAGMFASLAVSHFALEILPMYPAIFLCLLITTGAFVLSKRYDSQTIAAFALVGGYLPIFSIAHNLTLVYGAMGYFVVLNLLALTFAFYKKWHLTMFLGFVMNLIGTGYILACAYDFRHELAMQAVTILYVAFVFAVYTCIPIMGTYRAKTSFAKSDVILLALNTICSAVILYVVFGVFGLADYSGAMTVVFAAVYLGLGWGIERLFPNEKGTTALFYLTGLIFVVLVIPIQFGTAWLSLGWLAEATAFAVYGVLAGDRRFRRAGYVIGAFCLGAFLIFDVFGRVDDLFRYKYMAITWASVLLLAAKAYKKCLVSGGASFYKHVVLLNLWVWVIYPTGTLRRFLENVCEGTAYNPYFLHHAAGVVFTFAYAALLPLIPYIRSKGVRILSAVFACIGMLWLLIRTGTGTILIRAGHYDTLESGMHIYRDASDLPFGVWIVATLLLLMLTALALAAMRNVLKVFVQEEQMSVRWLPFGVSVYFLVILTQNLIVQYDMSLTSMVITLIYLAAALAWVWYGFVKRLSFLRRLGLVLTMVAVAKLFLIDKSNLTQASKIISYFACGFLMLGISYVYNYFSKRLLPKEDDAPQPDDNLAAPKPEPVEPDAENTVDAESDKPADECDCRGAHCASAELCSPVESKSDAEPECESPKSDDASPSDECDETCRGADGASAELCSATEPECESPKSDDASPSDECDETCRGADG